VLDFQLSNVALQLTKLSLKKNTTTSMTLKKYPCDRLPNTIHWTRRVHIPNGFWNGSSVLEQLTTRSKMPIAVLKSKFVVSFIIIFGTLSFPTDRHTQTHTCKPTDHATTVTICLCDRPPNTIHWTRRVHIPNGFWNGSSVLEQLTLVTNRERKCADTIGTVLGWPFSMLKYK